MKRLQLSAMLAGSSLLVIASALSAHAQQASPQSAQAEQGMATEEIIVTARRKEENLQNVPLTVDVVTADQVAKLDFRTFDQISSIVPGLSLNGPGGNVALRGVGYNPAAEGTPNVQTYFNDIPVQPAFFTGAALFDVGQIEVLRGPQGTLRGTSAPSGSITLTSRLPSLSQVGGYADVTGSSLNLINAQGAIGVPIVQDKVAVRIAALAQYQTGGSLVASANNPARPYSHIWGVRGTVLLQPIDNLKASVTYQRVQTDTRSYTQVESFGLVNPAIPLTAPVITPDEHLSTDSFPGISTDATTYVNAHIDWTFLGQQLSYVGGYLRDAPVDGPVLTTLDPANAFPTFPLLQNNTVVERQWSNELRLSSVDRIAGIFDYTVGGFYYRQPAHAVGAAPTAITISPALPLTAVATFPTTFDVKNTVQEYSFFGNITAHIGDHAEISGGLRHINSSVEQNSTIGGHNSTSRKPAKPTIYNVQLSYHFNQDLMVYAETGSSFRAGPTQVTSFPIITPNEALFTNIPDEKSKNYEIGIKGDFLDKKLRLDADAYLQNFSNFYLSPISQVYVAELVGGTLVPKQFGFAAAVPVKIRGFEASVDAQVTPQFSVSGNIAYAHAVISNGLVACNPPGPLPPTVAQIQAAANGDDVAACRVSYAASQVPPWNASLQGEYNRPLTDALDGYVRGLLSWQSKNPADPTNPYDVVPAYALLNLYLGVRDPQSKWSAELYAKNLFDTVRFTRIGNSAQSTTYILGFGAAVATSNYLSVSTIAPREFGFHVRYAFGSG